jgi:hypothetical protein
MADDRPEDIESSPDLGRPKRPPPTIDLEATEVSDKVATEVSDKVATEVSGEPAAGVSGESDAEPAGETADAGAGPGIGATAGEPPPGAVARTPWMASALVSAISGAVAAGLVVAVLWFLGWPSQGELSTPEVPQVDHAAVDALVARVANIESKTTESKTAEKTTESKTGTPSDSASDPTIAPRIDTLEKSIASLREELAASHSQSERLVAAVNELKATPRDASPPPDLSAINERLAQIERAARAQTAETAKQSAKPADDAPLRRVVAATLLDVSVRQGERYTAVLDAAKALAPDPGVLKPLDPFAASGVPSPAALSRDLLALLPKTAPAQETAATTGTGIVDRLQAGAARLVRIQRTDAADGTDLTAVIMRAAAAAQHNDIAGARRELSNLPGADRVAVQSGIDRLDARDLALATSRQFAADAMAALGKPAP